MPSPHRRPHVLVPALVLASAVAALALAGCSSGSAASGGGEQGAEGGAGAAPATAPVDTWPLTGLPVRRGSSSTDHPVLVTKIDNTGASAPQRGLGSADLVVEELVEGGATRLAVFFYSQVPGEVGPVRSMRASDIGIVPPADATVVTSGAAAVTVDRIKDAGIPWVTEGSAGFSRDAARSAPYNLFADLRAVARAARQPAQRPADYLPFGDAADLPGGRPATSLTARFSGGHATSWAYREGRWSVVDGYAAEGDAFAADSVLVLRVPVGDAGYLDPAGNPVPETQLDGTGEAMLLHEGRVVRGTWSKDSLEAPLRLATRAGDLRVPAGRTWVELVPAAGGDVTVS
ncbi:DUF3048 domain-containing protein [Nocardioides litoris]|uniref:DUF3048 domain-containing protein n=1 Tax=Nocardioides litoris TaxID=1926648 RepID=UPI00111EC07A|nr:DUF3048 domain-containing protein [Nocardioides litoris]